MTDQIVVKQGEDGKITVCFGDRCVVVECNAAAAEAAPAKPVRRPPKPPFRIEMIQSALSDIDPSDLEWEDVDEGTRTAVHRNDRMWISRLDD